ncbi:MAG: hypothetical protein COA79_10710 [Planctomycetota bacterium]|nr:MAG: hypothetical protein COA79_10710 [Planctomycetota bacterium]
MHFVVDQFINTEMSLMDILNKDNSNNLTVKMIREMREIIGELIELRTTSEGNQKMMQVYLRAEAFSNSNNEEDHYLLYLFYFIWFAYAKELNRLEDCQIIYERSQEINCDPPPILSLKFIKSNHLNYNEAKWRDLKFDFIVKHFSSSPRFLLFFLIWISKFSSEGLGSRISAYVNRLVPSKKNYEYQWHYLIFRLSDDIELGSLDECSRLICELQAILDSGKMSIKRSFGSLKLQYKLLRGDLSAIEISECQLSSNYKVLLMTNMNLINGDLIGALGSYNLDDFSIAIGIDSLFLFSTSIRLKLSNSEPKSAESILNLKIKKYGDHFFDNFYKVRIALLNNDKERAEHFFRKVYFDCQKYNALGLLDIELEMSLELEHGQIRQLMSSTFHQDKSTVIVQESKKKIDKELKGIEKIIGKSQAIKQIKEQIKKMADINMPILIMGETGVGKDIVATVLHETSKNAKEPFLPINCGALLETLLLSELNGHEAGAFTGAVQDKKGIFEASGMGTVFLDEFGEMPELVQVALLRTLESGTVRPVGSAKTIPFHCRVVAATNKNLEDLVAQKKFREDLYYRINAFIIKIPSLRERPEDIPLLFEFFLEKHGKSVKKNVSDKLLSAIKEYQWPGNVRELKNETDKMCLMHLDKEIYTIDDLYVLKEKLEKKEVIINEKIDKIQIGENDLRNLDEKIKSVKSKSRNSRSRKELLKEAFRKCDDLTRQEVIGILEISAATATNDLKLLIKEGFIEKIQPTSAPRTHYFKIIKLSL